jgi:hypothetical protein
MEHGIEVTKHSLQTDGSLRRRHGGLRACTGAGNCGVGNEGSEAAGPVPLTKILEQNRVIPVMLDGDTIRRGMDGMAVGEQGAAGIQVLHVG